MRLFTKIFLCTLAVVTAAVSVTGYLMISDSFTNAADRENQRGLEEYQLLKFTLQSGILSASSNDNLTEDNMTALAQQTAGMAPSGDQTAVFDSEKQMIYSTFPADYSFDSLNDANPDRLQYSTENRKGEYWLVVTGCFTQNDKTVYLSTARNITTIISEKNAMQSRFIMIFIIVLFISAVLMLLLSFILTNPIKKLTLATRHLANGELSERVRIDAADETGELAYHFNQMAKTIENTIHELELNAQQKEDFVANFAHELKTPLTSVIGYADMIYQKDDLNRQEIKDAAGYIVNEGIRLEALSLKLMELIVLNKQNFTFMELRADELLQDIADTLRPIMEQKGIAFTVTAQPAYVRVEFDLFKTLLLNLIDNAMKADSKHIELMGTIVNNNYLMSVTDDGRGIPADQLSRITEAFYMVDKSRSRSQHGAGLGLAIASRIAELHNTKLEYQSKVGVGTVVRFTVSMQGGAI